MAAHLIRPLRGHLPLKGKAFRRLIAAPTVHRKPVGAHSMRPPEFAPVPLVRKRQARERNRTSPNFPPTQAPSGAGRDRTQALLILRAGNVLPTSRDNPRNGVRGLAVLWARSARRPRPPAILWFLSHRWERNSPPAGGEIPLRKEPSSGPMRASGPTKKRSIIAPSSAPFGGTYPYPLCRFATSPLDKGSRPPRGRLWGEIAPSSVTASPCHLPPRGKAFWGERPLIRPRGKAS